MNPLLIIRAQPGASETAARAAALGLDCRIVPLFVAQSVPWAAPDAQDFDAVMLTSAHAPRHAGPGQADYRALPCFAVGESTAVAAEKAGYADIRCGSGDGDALLALVAREGVRRLLHLCGRNRRAYERPGIAITRTIVYAVDGVPRLPAAGLGALHEEAIVVLHSPRAAAHFGEVHDAAGLNRGSHCLAAISAATAQAAGTGWKRVAVADRPRDEALLELAAKLCKTVVRTH